MSILLLFFAHRSPGTKDRLGWVPFNSFNGSLVTHFADAAGTRTTKRNIFGTPIAVPIVLPAKQVEPAGERNVPSGNAKNGAFEMDHTIEALGIFQK